MRFIKLGIISVIGLSIVIFLLSLLIPSQMRVSRAITIDTPRDSVLPRLNDLREWSRWNKLIDKPELTHKTSEKNSFRSDEITVILTQADTAMVKTTWERAGQEPVQSGLGITAAGNSTIVQWYFDFKVKWYPWEKFGSIIFDSQMGPSMEQSLAQLKKLAEGHP